MTLPSWYDSWLTDDHYSDRCDKCENKANDLTEVSGGNMVCDNCLEEYFECNECHQYHHVDEVSEVEEVCKQCFEDNYVKCSVCETYFNAEKQKDYYEHYPVCDKCKGETK